MRKSFGWVLAGLTVVALAVGVAPASATTISYQLNITNTCNCGSTPYGQIDLSDSGAGIPAGSILVTVNLFNGNRFVSTGAGDASFAFNLTNPDPTVTFSNLTANFAANSTSPGTIGMDGFGNFEYGVHTTLG